MYNIYNPNPLDEMAPILLRFLQVGVVPYVPYSQAPMSVPLVQAAQPVQPQKVVVYSGGCQNHLGHVVPCALGPNIAPIPAVPIAVPAATAAAAPEVAPKEAPAAVPGTGFQGDILLVHTLFFLN